MIYLTWFLFISFTILIFYSGYQTMTDKDFKNSVLWLAATLVFLNNADYQFDKLIEHYEQDKIVKEVSV